MPLDDVASTPDIGPASDQLRVAFPATPVFTRIGRVAVVGLALRLGVDVSSVERLRAAVDLAVGALHGPGRIETTGRWSDDTLTIELTNPEVAIVDPAGLVEELQAQIDHVEVDPSSVRLTLELPGS